MAAPDLGRVQQVVQQPRQVGGLPPDEALRLHRDGLPSADLVQHPDRVAARHKADGEWRDYAIDFLKDRAVFSVYRRASEVPIYRIEKDPRLARKQGMYSVISATGLILRRGHELERVLLVLAPKPALV